MTSATYASGELSGVMSLDKEKESQIADYFLKSFEEKTSFDYDILDSMVNELKPEISPDAKNR